MFLNGSASPMAVTRPTTTPKIRDGAIARRKGSAPKQRHADGLAAENGNERPDIGFQGRVRSIMGLSVCDLGWRDALAMMAELAARPEGQVRLSFLNANNANIMRSDAQYRAMIAEHIVLPDGVGIDIACYVLHGRKFTANLNGTDFVPAMLTYIGMPKRVGLVGGTPEVLAGALANFKAHAPWHHFIAISDGYFDKSQSGDVVARIAEAKLDILLVGMGTPLQEKWVQANIEPQHARVVACVGALFDFVSGIVPRAPVAVRKMRLEWAYRIVCEPKRLWRRYILGGPMFLLRLARFRLFPGRVAGQQPVPPEPVGKEGKGIPSEIAFPLKSASRR